MKKSLPVLLVASLLAAFVITQNRSNASPAQGACTYQCAIYDWTGGGYTYAMRTDGVLVRLHAGDWEILEFPNPAPPGRYVSLYRETNNPYLTGFFAVREDGAVFFRADASFYYNQWQLMATLPGCDPVPTAPSTLGNVKGKYR